MNLDAFYNENYEWQSFLPSDEYKRLDKLTLNINGSLERINIGRWIGKERRREMINALLGLRDVSILRELIVESHQRARKAAERKHKIYGWLFGWSGYYAIDDSFDDYGLHNARCVGREDDNKIRSDNGLMRELVNYYLKENDYNALMAIDCCVLRVKEKNWKGFKELRKIINERAVEILANWKNDVTVTREAFRKALMQLIETTDFNGEPVFRNNNHWMAVMRVAIDVKLVPDNAPAAFVDFIKELELPALPKPLVRQSIGNSYNGIYTKPLTEWTDENFLRWSVDGKSVRKVYFTNMRSVAKKLQNFLSYYCQRQ